MRQEAAKVKAKEGGADEEAVEDAFAAEINTRVVRWAYVCMSVGS